MNWKGVMPAITTCFTDDLRVDYGFMAGHCRWLLDNGCSGIVALGSLGEGAALSFGLPSQRSRPRRPWRWQRPPPIRAAMA